MDVNEAGQGTHLINSLKYALDLGMAPTQSIAENAKAIIEQLEEEHWEGLTTHLMAMGRFHNYGFWNRLEIERQKLSATQVAGIYP